MKSNKSLKNLVQDCVLYRLSTDEALEYIEVRYKKISERHYFRVKEKLESLDEIKKWLDNYVEKQIAIDHKTMIEELDFIQKTCISQLRTELEKPENQQTKRWMGTLMRNMRENAEFRLKLGLGGPIIQHALKRLNPLPDTKSESEYDPYGMITI